ncbi:MAG: cyclic nucleotide-binding domain-containing protein [Desulfobacterales bacterium]|nr:MAG: cyclic nucleotide-binding domain-containing protein [Desulfobacterales bacterium]
MNSSEKNDATAPCEFMDNLNLLRQTYFFSSFPLETLKVIAYLCAREKFKKGLALFNQNEDDGQAFLVIDGKARLEREDDGKMTVIRECHAGEFLGGLTLLGGRHRLFSLIAVEDTTCLIIHREKFTKAIKQFPDIMPKILKAVVDNISTWEERFLTERAEECGGCLEKLGVSLV